jgi:hypothetical protein
MSISDLPALNASLNFVSTVSSRRLVSDPPRALAPAHRLHDHAVISSTLFLAVM